MTPERYAQVKQLFLAASERDDAERREFLASACGDDAELRAEVESLLAHDRSQTLLRAGLDTRSQLAASTPTAPARHTLRRKLRTLSLLTQQLGARGHLAIGGLIACVVIAALGLAVDAAIRAAQRGVRTELLNKLVDTKATALELWIEQETSKVESFARDAELRSLVDQLVQLAAKSTEVRKELQNSPLQSGLRDELRAVVGRDVRYAVWDRRYRTVADWSPDGLGLGEGASADGAAVLTRVFAGETLMQLPGVREPITENYPVDRARAPPLHGRVRCASRSPRITPSTGPSTRSACSRRSKTETGRSWPHCSFTGWAPKNVSAASCRSSALARRGKHTPSIAGA